MPTAKSQRRASQNGGKSPKSEAREHFHGVFGDIGGRWSSPNGGKSAESEAREHFHGVFGTTGGLKCVTVVTPTPSLGGGFTKNTVWPTTVTF